MVKEVGAFSLIIFLFVILVSWWAISAFRMPPQGQILAVGNSQGQVLPQPDQVTVYHSTAKGVEQYKGYVNVPNCSQFWTGISASGHSPAHLHLSFTVAKDNSPCSLPNGETPVPFDVSYSSNVDKSSTLDSVEINNTAATFSVVDVK
jgi:hypothetical protein